jgi:DNA-binding NarL/FixJ family response regulator
MDNKAKIRIGLVDDQLLFRKGLRALLEDYKHINIKLEAANGVEFFEELKKIKEGIDVLVLDVEMPEMDGLEVLKILQIKSPRIKTLVLTMHNEDELIYGLVKLGAKGFLPKNAEIEEVLDAIDTLFVNELYFSEDISKVLIKNVVKKQGPKLPLSLSPLTEREKEIIKLVCEEKSTKEIADSLFISERTVNSHKTNIFEKTKSKNSAGIVMYAIRNGIID